jgi:YMGG-like Gly-zipper
MSLTISLTSVAQRGFLVAFAMACVIGGADRAAGQYYYQPGPDYYHNDTASDTIVGGALGAVTGAIVGGKHKGTDALIGAGIGAVTGNLLGQSKDRADERNAAAGAAAAANMNAQAAAQNAQAAAQAVTNYDLVNMTKSGLSDDLIISTIQSRGARLDLSPQQLIALKQQGVSDRVVLAAQNMGQRSQYAPPPVGGPGVPVVAVAPAPTMVIVAPRPYYYYGPGPYYHAHAYYRFH